MIKYLLKTEEAGMLMLASFAYAQTGLSWWIFAALFLTPDIGILGYLFGPKTGAITYNLFHHKGIAVLVWLFGFLTYTISFEVAGIILFAHSSFDRILGYGLKYPDHFRHTHLGIIGKDHHPVNTASRL